MNLVVVLYDVTACRCEVGRSLLIDRAGLEVGLCKIYVIDRYY